MPIGASLYSIHSLYCYLPGFLLLINDWSKDQVYRPSLLRILGAALLAAVPGANKLISLPLLRIFSGYPGPL